MKTTIVLILTSFVCLAATDAKAQADEVFHNKRYSIALEPLFMTGGGIGIDFEMRLKGSRNWINLRLAGFGLSDNDSERTSYYITENFTISSGFENFRSYSGLSAQATFKTFFIKDIIYWGCGFEYSYYDVSYYTETYRPFTDDGMKFYEYYQGNESQYFNKLYPFLSIGVRTPSRKHFFAEGYISSGYSYSFYDKYRKAYNDNLMSFGRRGFAMSFGGRVGWQF